MSKNEFVCDCNVIHDNLVNEVKNSMPDEYTFNNLADLLYSIVMYLFTLFLNNSINSSDSGKNGSLCNVLLIYPRAFNKNCPGRISGNDLLCISHNCE